MSWCVSSKTPNGNVGVSRISQKRADARAAALDYDGCTNCIGGYDMAKKRIYEAQDEEYHPDMDVKPVFTKHKRRKDKGVKATPDTLDRFGRPPLDLYKDRQFAENAARSKAAQPARLVSLPDYNRWDYEYPEYPFREDGY